MENRERGVRDAVELARELSAAVVCASFDGTTARRGRDGRLALRSREHAAMPCRGATKRRGYGRSRTRGRATNRHRERRGRIPMLAIYEFGLNKMLLAFSMLVTSRPGRAPVGAGVPTRRRRPRRRRLRPSTGSTTSPSSTPRSCRRTGRPARPASSPLRRRPTTRQTHDGRYNRRALTLRDLCNHSVNWRSLALQDSDARLISSHQIHPTPDSVAVSDASDAGGSLAGSVGAGGDHAGPRTASAMFILRQMLERQHRRRVSGEKSKAAKGATSHRSGKRGTTGTEPRRACAGTGRTRGRCEGTGLTARACRGVRAQSRSAVAMPATWQNCTRKRRSRSYCSAAESRPAPSAAGWTHRSPARRATSS